MTMIIDLVYLKQRKTVQIFPTSLLTFGLSCYDNTKEERRSRIFLFPLNTLPFSS
jgi:hypothetical protein